MRIFEISLKEKYEFLGCDGRAPRLVCYLPYCLKEMGRENEKRPCMVVCPGGGYGNCSEREAEPIALKFLNMGFNVFVLYYSVAPHRYPVQLREVAAVFEEIYKNADKWNCDTNKIGIIGFSAGGHLIAHYSNEYNSDAVREVFPESKKPNFSVLCYPVISQKHGHQGSYNNLLWGYSDEAKAELLKTLNLNEAVSDQTPPAFIWTTAKDKCVPPDNALRYALALDEKGIDYELHVYPRLDHGKSTASLENNWIGNNETEADFKRVHHWCEDCVEFFRLYITEKF